MTSPTLRRPHRIALAVGVLFAWVSTTAWTPSAALAHAPGSDASDEASEPRVDDASGSVGEGAAKSVDPGERDDEPAPPEARDSPRTAEPGPAPITPASVMPTESAAEQDATADGPSPPARATTATPGANSPAGPATPLGYDPQVLSALRTRDAGIALAVVGGVLGVAAALLYFLSPCESSPGNDCRLEQRRGAALGMGIPAGVLVVAGVVTATVGQVRARRAALEVEAGRRGAFVSLRASF